MQRPPGSGPPALPGPRPRSQPWLRSAAPASLVETPKAHSGLSLDSRGLLCPRPHTASEHPHTSRPAPFRGSPGIVSSAAGSCPDRPIQRAAICKPQSTFSAPLLITVSTTWDSLVYGLTPPAPSFLLEYELHRARIVLFFTATTQKSSRHVLGYAEYINESKTPGNHPFISFFLPLKAEANQTHYQR